MPTIRIYADENVDHAIIEGLRRRGVDAWSTTDAEKLGTSDEEQLAYAASERAVLFTHDTDLIVLARQWEAKGKTHFGVIYVHQDSLSIGDCIRRLKDYADILDAEELINRVEFL